jgi:nitrile hydratase
MGGMHGFGPVQPEPDEPVFHAQWERRCFALTLAAGFLGRWNIDMSRYARERMDPADYLSTSYYEHWLHGLETLVVERDLVTAAELASGQADGPAPASLHPLPAEQVSPVLRVGSSARMADELPARFSVGQRVRVCNVHPAGHIRAPRYVRGHRGRIDRDHGVFIFPDTHATGAGKVPQHCYSVRFEGSELWGPDGGARDAVYVDLFDDYLESSGD